VQIHNTIIETIGDTPLVRLNHVTGGIEAQVVVKVEFFNPGGSIKDRIGIQIVEDAEKEGRLKPGGTIVEATSGNTGVGLAIAAALRGYKCVFVLADKQSQEKIQVLRAFGARVIVTPTDVEPEDPRSYYSVARRVVEETPNAILANQYHNPSNPRTHYLTTGPEIWEQTDGKVDVVVMGVGTGGTITGVSRYLKEKNPDIKIVGVDPMGSILYKHWKTGETDGAYSYLTEGIGEDFVPTSYDASSVDDYVQVTDKESFLMLRRLVREEGIFAGVSCGSAVAGALKYVRREQLGPDKLVVVILPDSGTRYLSKAFNDDWMRENGLLDPIWIGASVETLLDQRPPQKVILATCDEAISSVVQKMREHNVSQLPVIDDESTLVGIVQEVDLLNYMLQNGATNNAEIGLEDAGVVSKDIATVNMNTALESLMTIFNTQPVVVVVDNDRVQNIITKIDLIDFLAKSGA
jgi:cystathionine beta-synthase